MNLNGVKVTKTGEQNPKIIPSNLYYHLALHGKNSQSFTNPESSLVRIYTGNRDRSQSIQAPAEWTYDVTLPKKPIVSWGHETTDWQYG